MDNVRRSLAPAPGRPPPFPENRSRSRHGLAEMRRDILPKPCGGHASQAARRASSSASLTSMSMRRSRDRQPDDVTGAEQGQRPSDMGFERDLTDTGAVAPPAPSRVGQVHGVAHARAQQLGRDRQSPIPGPPTAPAFGRTSTVSSVASRSGSSIRTLRLKLL